MRKFFDFVVSLVAAIVAAWLIATGLSLLANPVEGPDMLPGWLLPFAWAGGIIFTSIGLCCGVVAWKFFRKLEWSWAALARFIKSLRSAGT